MEDGCDWDTRRTLFTCSLVDRAWKCRVKLHLSKSRFMKIYSDNMAPFRTTNPSLSSPLAGLMVIKRSETTSISSFVVQHQHQLPKFKYLSIEELALTREHKFLCRTPLFRSVRTLKLVNIQTCELSQLVHFIRSFPSLSDLDLSFAHSKIERQGKVIYTPPLINTTRSLRSLRLSLVPGISMLLDELLKESSLFLRLETLVLAARGMLDEEEFRSSFEGLGRLLDRCSTSVEDFRLYLDRTPIIVDLPDLGMFLNIIHTSCSYVFPVQLGYFSNLKCLTYGSLHRDSVLQYAIKQLKAIGSSGSLVQVTLDITICRKIGVTLDWDICHTLDKLLSGNQFPCLKTVFLHESISFKHFPKLNRLGLLRLLSCSHWRKYVVFIEAYTYMLCIHLTATH